MSWNPVWEQVFSNQEWGKYPPEDFIRFIARNFYNVENRTKIKILEVGCGPGANLWFLAREGFETFGIDGSQTAITRAKNRLNTECPNWRGELTVGDFSILPYPNDYFDAVVDIEAVYCNSYATSKQIYGEMARVVRGGGKLYSRTFAPNTWGMGTGEKVGHNAWIVSEGPLLGKGYSRFTEYEEIKNLMDKFEIESIEMMTRSIDNIRHEIKEWLIVGSKR